MDWIEEMREAMKMMNKACQKNTAWADCSLCPFTEMCDILIDYSMMNHDVEFFEPSTWEV